MTIEKLMFAVMMGLAACGGPAKPATTGVGNNGGKPLPPEVAGRVVDVKTHEALPGATVVIMGPDKTNPLNGISDEHGSFRITDVPTGQQTVMVYYGDKTTTQTVMVPSEAAMKIELAIDSGVAEVKNIQATPPTPPTP
jgi:hypothetical protein